MICPKLLGFSASLASFGFVAPICVYLPDSIRRLTRSVRLESQPRIRSALESWRRCIHMDEFAEGIVKLLLV